MSYKNIAIITGANSGFGKEFLKLLINEEEITEIWAVARNKARLNQLVDEFGSKVKVFSKDLSKIEEVKEIGTFLSKENVCIKYLINNAGFAKFCSYNDLSIDESINMIDLNISAVVALGLICIPYMQKGSHIINISSQASFQPLPYQNIYSSTKAFVRNYTRALNVELKSKGINAITVCPGWMSTNLFKRGIVVTEKGTKHFPGIVSPDVVAKKALKDTKKNKDISVYGINTKSSHLLAKLLPQKMMMKVWLMQQHIKE
ncbi:SDR family NAD(P)-dependent oxidoreductase [Clostridioides difficile]|uniref:Short chain dehydrogenase/reductase n=2 Tax=Clostridioides difficile TaxID=1496 RepID=A0AAX3H6C7_CLODI|nr:SDR family NAD(P)-dependent oxidoreductase [Clostridioides difficile]AVD36044.1 SDR family NAD(P)-dependent oxidoreductase [Clostridioides difficile]AVD40506.1 SDR family NAD(P)-dependent oxidoreductase [Clostridioides difficile]AVD44017.1 SDR family NAD(P)-dependent oxidoreductase [Clostridioides difficile]AXU67104.1 short chain dehydrogenase [Clostridioides difficile]AXU89276.1 short chain dehydrogenase [Clostridioides difficile]